MKSVRGRRRIEEEEGGEEEAKKKEERKNTHAYPLVCDLAVPRALATRAPLHSSKFARREGAEEGGRSLRSARHDAVVDWETCKVKIGFEEEGGKEGRGGQREQEGSEQELVSKCRRLSKKPKPTRSLRFEIKTQQVRR